MNRPDHETPPQSAPLDRLQEGDGWDLDSLIPLVYEELREIAHRHRLRWTGDESLGTTGLVNETYLKLAERSEGEYVSRAHVLGIAARAMRQILVDHYRAGLRTKRGGGNPHVPLEAVAEVLASFPPLSPPEEEAIVTLHESLERLGVESERHARIIECRFFGGMTIEETAEALDVSPATVKRGSAVARAWLGRDMSEPESEMP